MSMGQPRGKNFGGRRLGPLESSLLLLCQLRASRKCISSAGERLFPPQSTIQALEPGSHQPSHSRNSCSSCLGVVSRGSPLLDAHPDTLGLLGYHYLLSDPRKRSKRCRRFRGNEAAIKKKSITTARESRLAILTQDTSQGLG